MRRLGWMAVALLLAATAAHGARWIVPAHTATGFTVVERTVRPQTANGWALRDRPVKVPPVEIEPPDQLLLPLVRGENPDLLPDDGSPLRAHAANRIAELQALGLTGDGIAVAVLDTGIAPSPSGAERLVVASWTAYADAVDRYGHGTAVCGVLAGSPAAVKYAGIAIGCRLLVGKVLDDSGSGDLSDVILGLNWAVDRGAQVVNLSLGSTPSAEPDALELVCENLVAKGIIVVCAAGNSGYGPPFGEEVPYQIGSPACSAQVVCVGSVSGDDRLSGFSSRGPSIRGHAAPDFCAFGHVVPLAYGEGTAMLAEAASCGNSGYRPASGTSFACPYVAGLAALWLSAGGKAGDFERLLAATCSGDVGQLPDDVSQANACGAGAVRAYVAFKKAGLVPEPPAPEPPPEPKPPTRGCGSLAAETLLGFAAFAVGCGLAGRRRRRP